MAAPVIMPRQGQSVESCIIAKWNKQKGDKIQAGDILFTYETDKATFDEEAKVDGTLLDIFFEEGDDVPVLLNVCVIGNEGESTEEFNPNNQAGSENDKIAEAAPVDQNQQAVSQIESIPAVQINSQESIRISPRAKNLADKAGLDYRYAAPSGPYGRIIERDILAIKDSGVIVTPSAREQYMSLENANIKGTGLGGKITTSDLQNAALCSANDSTNINTPSAAQPLYQEVKLSNIRKVISKAMMHSIASTCQLTLNTSFDATNILEFRKQLKESKDRLGLANITLNDIILYAVSRTLLNHKDLNAHMLDDRMLYFSNVHLGVAVDTDRGLMVPTVFNANLMSLNEISKEAKKLVTECQKGTINPDQLKGASFTITNLGTLDIESFTPVLNPPQTGILGVNTIVQRVREVHGEYEFYPAMGLSLTFDHRALDGAPAARFLQDLKKNLESFSIMLAI